MGYTYSAKALDKALSELSHEYTIFAPKLFPEGAAFSGNDIVRYGKVSSIEEVVFDEKSYNSPKEAFSALSQTLFYFTEDAVTESSPPAKKALVFMRSCDIHALKGLEDIFLRNKDPDYFYDRVRKNTRIVLMPCKTAFDSCFCVDMGTNKTDEYDLCVQKDGDQYFVACNADDLKQVFAKHSESEKDFAVPFPAETKVRVNVSQKIEESAATLPMWEEYDGRCIACGRCTFSCPSCACWSMQDLFYSENSRAGERKRVWSSCMVDRFSDMAGGESFRKKNGERMRFKTLHKIYHHKKRFGRFTCTGCGRCDDVCPEYISFSNIINKVSAAFDGAKT
ncbi:MAG: anaerobic sulfite reductase subunit AsrA [Spirochaetes bacterium]|nr:anaerobic sulfite reductase subunit AsrA [Spirochaetota bacterium]